MPLFHRYRASVLASSKELYAVSRARRLTLRSSRRVPAGRFRPSFHSRPYATCLHARLNSNVRRLRTQPRDNAALVQASKDILPRISDLSVPPPSMTSHKLRKHFAIQSMSIEQSQFKRSGEPRTAATCLHSANAFTGAKSQRASVKIALHIGWRNRVTLRQNRMQ